MLVAEKTIRPASEAPDLAPQGALGKGMHQFIPTKASCLWDSWQVLTNCTPGVKKWHLTEAKASCLILSQVNLEENTHRTHCPPLYKRRFLDLTPWARPGPTNKSALLPEERTLFHQAFLRISALASSGLTRGFERNLRNLLSFEPGMSQHLANCMLRC